MLGAKPPSSPTLHASSPYFFLMTLLRLWYTSLPIFMASAKLLAPTGAIMNSWKASMLPACSPPLITLKKGTGMVKGPLALRPASLAM
jgi:hypothetical protein